MSKVEVGDTYTLKQGGTATVIDYQHSDRVLIKHNDKHEHTHLVQAGHLKRGNVKNPYHPSVYGVGYIGFGEYRVSKDRKHLAAYKKWQSMIERCYSKRYQSKKPTYIGCTVADEWHDFQNFAEWFYADPHYDLNYELDKDILFMGNKVYSNKTYALVPSDINSFAKGYTKKSGLPLGISHRNKSYSVRMYKAGESKWIGSYDNLGDAVRAHARARSCYARQLAEHWKNKVSYPVYRALCNWDDLKYSEPDLTPFISTMQNNKGG